MAAFGLYKPGQGYWTRVMTAVGVTALGLSTAGWAWRQLGRVQTEFEALYLQGGVAGLIVLATAGLAYWLAGRYPRTNEFFIATEGEMRKVNWSTRREVVGSTWVVIGVSVLIALILFIADLLFSTLFRWMGVLQTG